jgi:hypothetical protein
MWKAFLSTLRSTKRIPFKACRRNLQDIITIQAYVEWVKAFGHHITQHFANHIAGA